MALSLILAMFVVAERTGQKELIFPEISALALGTWVMKEPPWPFTPLRLWLSPTLAACTGTWIVRCLACPPVLMIAAALCLVFLELKLLRSAVVPSVSAAVLPVVTHTTTWRYPLAVVIWSGLVALGACWRLGRERNGLRGRNAEQRSEGGLGWSHGIRLLGGLLAASGIAVASGCTYLVAPPLMVAFIELARPGGRLRGKAARAMVLMLSCAVSGTILFGGLRDTLQWPPWVAAGATGIAAYAACRVLDLHFPPAAAIALLPGLVPAERLGAYPWQVLGGCCLFLTLRQLCFGNPKDAGGEPSHSPTQEAHP
jgi:hypothetical protein